MKHALTKIFLAFTAFMACAAAARADDFQLPLRQAEKEAIEGNGETDNTMR